MKPVFGKNGRIAQGVTLIGRLFDEGTLGTAGIALEHAFGFANDRPTGFWSQHFDFWTARYTRVS